MKCDELKPLKNIEIAFNTTTQQEQVIAEDSEENCYGFDSWEEVYLKYQVDAAIAELKQKLHDAEMQADLAECAVTEYKIDCDKLKDENRRLKRALWRAIALFCARSCEYFSGIMSHCLMGQDDLYRRCEEKKNKYLNAVYKCRAKAEEYK